MTALVSRLRDLLRDARADYGPEPFRWDVEPRAQNRPALKIHVFTTLTLDPYYDAAIDRHEAVKTVIVEALNVLPALLDRVEALEAVAEWAKRYRQAEGVKRLTMTVEYERTQLDAALARLADAEQSE